MYNYLPKRGLEKHKNQIRLRLIPCFIPMIAAMEDKFSHLGGKFCRRYCRLTSKKFIFR
jgi:hypothetical protein